jgi:hypothetical protein
MQTRIVDRIRTPWWMLVLAGLASGCEQTVAPAADERVFRVTIPGTAAHGERLEERWRECLRVHSSTVCERRFRAGRPPGASVFDSPAGPPSQGPGSAVEPE